MVVATGTLLAIGAFGMAAAGTAVSYTASRKMAAAQEEGNRIAYESQKQMIAYQQQQEALRRQAMELDSARRRREIIRQSLQARSFALSMGTAQGVDKSSVMGGAFGQIAGQTGRNLLGVSQQEELSGKMFDINEDITALKLDTAGKMLPVSAQQTSAYRQAALGQGLSSLGNMFLQNMGTINKVGTYFSTPKDSSSYFSAHSLY